MQVDTKFPIGTKVKLSAEAARMFPRMKNEVGQVSAHTREGLPKITWTKRKTVDTFHPTLLRPYVSNAPSRWSAVRRAALVLALGWSLVSPVLAGHLESVLGDAVLRDPVIFNHGGHAALPALFRAEYVKVANPAMDNECRLARLDAGYFGVNNGRPIRAGEPPNSNNSGRCIWTGNVRRLLEFGYGSAVFQDHQHYPADDVERGALASVLPVDSEANTPFVFNALSVPSANVSDVVVLHGHPGSLSAQSLNSGVGGALGFLEGRIDQVHTNGTQQHTDDGSAAHEERPDGHGLLRYQIALLAGVLTPFLLCLGYAVRLTGSGKTQAGIICWTIGVGGIFAGTLIGGPLIFGLFG